MVSLKNLSVLFLLRRHLAVYHLVATLPILVDILDNVCSRALRSNLLYAKSKITQTRIYRTHHMGLR